MAKQEKTPASGEYASVIDCRRGPGTRNGSSITYTENMYPKKDGDRCLESIPGVRTLAKLEEPVKNLFVHRAKSGEDYLFIHSGTHIYRIEKSKIGESAEAEAILDVDNSDCTFAELGTRLFVLQGSMIAEIFEDKSTMIMSDEASSFGYIPTTYINGAAHEKRNLLTEKFKEKYKINTVDDSTYGSPELTYSVIDKEKKLCAVTGVAKNAEGTIYIPRFKSIGGVKHLVTEIAANAFTNREGVSKIVTNRGLERIGSAAFLGMSSLREIYLSDTVEQIGDYCFSICTSLSLIHIGVGLVKIGKAAFLGCPTLSIDYAGSRQMLEEIENIELIVGSEMSYHVGKYQTAFAVPIFSPYKEINSVTVAGKEVNYAFIDSEEGVVITTDDPSEYSGEYFTVNASMSCEGEIFSEYPEACLSPIKTISGCTVAFTFEGRLFLSGNRSFPGAVFYTEIADNGTVCPTYFSVASFITVGTKNQNVTAMAPLGRMLAAFTDRAEQSGSVFLFKPSLADGKTVFKRAATLNHTAVTAAKNFLGEVVTASQDKLSRYRGTSGRCTAFETVSAPISELLLGRSEKISLCSWKDFLTVAIGKDLFLADYSERIRTDGDDCYDWYLIKGAGGYTGDRPMIIYADEPYGDFVINPEKALTPVSEFTSINVTMPQGGEFYYYAEEEGKKVLLYNTPFRCGGKAENITCLANIGGRLIIGTDGGRLNTFNDDMRGIPPKYLRDHPYFLPKKYEADMGDATHPLFYTFTDHIPTYKVVTEADDCGRFYLAKRTVKGSTVISVKPICGKINVTALYDEDRRRELGAITGEVMNFVDLDFGNLSLSASPICRRILYDTEKDWSCVRFSIESEGLSPFGIYSVAYRYTHDDRPQKETQ